MCVFHGLTVSAYIEGNTKVKYTKRILPVKWCFGLVIYS